MLFNALCVFFRRQPGSKLTTGLPVVCVICVCVCNMCACVFGVCVRIHIPTLVAHIAFSSEQFHFLIINARPISPIPARNRRPVNLFSVQLLFQSLYARCHLCVRSSCFGIQVVFKRHKIYKEFFLLDLLLLEYHISVYIYIVMIVCRAL